MVAPTCLRVLMDVLGALFFCSSQRLEHTHNKNINIKRLTPPRSTQQGAAAGPSPRVAPEMRQRTADGLAASMFGLAVCFLWVNLYRLPGKSVSVFVFWRICLNLCAALARRLNLVSLWFFQSNRPVRHSHFALTAGDQRLPQAKRHLSLVLSEPIDHNQNPGR